MRLWDEMKIADGVDVLKLTMDRPGGPNMMHATLIRDNDTVILVDTGLPGQLPEIREVMAKAGVPFDKLNKVIITHQDSDHIGGLPEILKESPHKVEVIAHAEEKPYIQGDKRPIKLTPERMAQIKAELRSLPEAERQARKAQFENYPKANVDRTVADGEELPYCGGIIVIHTPGHTPGHISLYLKRSKVLITGDAMNVIGDELYGPNPQYTYDLDLATKSLEKFSRYDIATVICYHSGVYGGNANRRIAELAKRAPFKKGY